MILNRSVPRWAVPLNDSHVNGEVVRVRAAKGGRGSGKSHEFAERIVKRTVKQKTNVVCLREVQKSIKFSVKQLLENKIEKFGLGHLFDIQRDQITNITNGSLIIFQGLQNHTADSIKSLEDFDIAWVEEAQTISQFSLDILRPTIRKPGSELWYTWNPRNPDDPIEYLVKDTPKDAIILTVNYWDNPWFPDVLQKEMEYDRARDIDKYNWVWLGFYELNSEARIFKNWRVEEFEAEPGTIFRQGADWGYAVDPTVLIRTFIVGKYLFIDYEAHQHECDIDNIPLLFGTIPDSELYPIIADSSRPETIAYCRKNGYPRIYSSTKGAGSVKDGIEWLKSFDIIVHPRCIHTIDELTNYKYKVDKLTGKITGIPEDKKNHVIDAIRYSCEASRKQIATETPVETPQPQRNFW